MELGIYLGMWHSRRAGALTSPVYLWFFAPNSGGPTPGAPPPPLRRALATHSAKSRICVLFMNTRKMVVLGTICGLFCFFCGAVAVARDARTPRRWELACVAWAKFPSSALLKQKATSLPNPRSLVGVPMLFRVGKYRTKEERKKMAPKGPAF